METKAFSTEIPVPLVPDHVNFPTHSFISFDIDWLTDGEMVNNTSGEGFRAAIILLAKAWKQTPAGSLPDNDATLSRMAGLGRGAHAAEQWEKIKDDALSDFVLCQDGRFYSRTLAPRALEAWASTESQRNRTAAARRARYPKSEASPTGSSVASSVAENVTGSVTEPVTEPVAEAVTRSVATSVAESRLDKTRPDQTRSNQTRPNGDERRSNQIERRSGDVGPAPFVGTNIILTAREVADYAKKYPNLAEEMPSILAEIDSKIDRVSDLQKRSAVNRRLRDENTARERAQEARTVPDDDLPF